MDYKAPQRKLIGAVAFVGEQLAGITDASGYANDAASILVAVLSIVGRVSASKIIGTPKS
ncbi:hypothetical protein AU476_05120 [Cupriavidus sp. UYMSc13B]|nr:hypothetical protein AU476_05120 [Cupriavidus sp. UYMSc13B]